MTVNTIQTDYILSDDKLNFSPTDATCTAYFQGSGFRAMGNCGGSGTTVAMAVSPAFPIPFNERIIGIKVQGSYSGPRGSIQAFAGLTTNQGNAQNKIVPTGGGGWEYTVDVDSTGYGVKSPMLIGVAAPADGGITLTVSHVILTTLQDDTLDPGTPPAEGNGAPPQVDGIDCNVEVNYQYGIGPNCVGEGSVFAIRSGVTNIGNIVSCTFTPAVDFKVLFIENWDYTAIRADPYFIIEEPLGTQQLAFGVRSYRTPVDIGTPLKANKLEVFGPIIGQSYIMYIRITKEYTVDVGPGVPVGGQFPDTSAVLNGIRDAIIDGTQQTTDGLSIGIHAITDAINNFLPKSNTPDNPFLAGIFNSLNDALTNFLDTASQKISDGINFAQKRFTASISESSSDLTVFLNKLGELFSGGIGAKTNNQNDIITPLLKSQGAVIDNLLKGKYANSQAFYDALKAAGNAPDLIEWAQNVYTLVLGYFDFLKVKSDIADISLRQITLAEYTPNVNDMATSLGAFRKGLINLGKLYEYGAKHGFSEDKVNEIVAANRPIPGPNELQFGSLRGFITDAQVDSYLGQLGYDLQSIKLIKQLYDTIPSPTDLTRLADKHVYSGDIPDKYGTKTEKPAQYTTNMKLWGISEKWSDDLWSGHWSLPSLQSLFDMFHRGQLSRPELEVALSLTDIVPFFRDKLITLNYALITRVDIRRFYAQGVMSEEEVYQAYLKLGFSPTDAKKQQQFTILHERQSEEPAKVKIHALTSAVVVKAYKSNIIGKQEAINRLGQVGYLPADANIILDLENQLDSTSILADKTQHYHDRLLNHILASFSKATISETEARQYLAQIGVPANEIESEITYTNIERILALKEYAETHVRNAYTSGQLSKTDATNLLTSIGFNMSEILFLFEELDLVKNLRNKPLTEAQIKDIYGNNLITAQEVYDEFISIGYSDKHANWLTKTITGLQ